MRTQSSHISHQTVKTVRKKQEPKATNSSTGTRGGQQSENIRRVLGAPCCVEGRCLNKLDYDIVASIFDQFNHRDRVQKYIKIKEFLMNSKQQQGTLHAHTIAGELFVLRFEVKPQQFVYLCPKAFKKVLFIGMTTLEQLANANVDVNVVRRVSLDQKEKVGSICQDWIAKNIVPLASQDDYAPTYIRCDAYATRKAALINYVEYLQEEYAGDAKFMSCSESTWKFTLVKCFPNLLWGEGGFCGECFIYDGEIRKMTERVNSLTRRGEKESKAENAAAKIELMKWKEAKQEHTNRASELRALSHRYKYALNRVFCYLLLFFLILFSIFVLFHIRFLLISSNAKILQKDLSWIVDYMQHKRLPVPAPTTRMSEYKAWIDQWGFGGMSRIHLYLGGLYDARRDTSDYYVHCNFTESSNSILTLIWLKLISVLEYSTGVETLTITLDGKSTGMNY
jgi:hypothetical protein